MGTAVAGFTDYLEQKLLDHIFTDGSYAPPATLYVGLFKTLPDDAGANGTEVAFSGAYVRVAVSASTFGAAAGTSPAVKSNTSKITFGSATSAWGTVVGFGIFDAAGTPTGNLLIGDVLTASKVIDPGDICEFDVGALSIKLGDPGDTYT